MVDRYDPEGHLLEQYGMLPMMPDFVDPTLFGQDQRNPGWSMAARNPGVPVIMPTDVPTNPNRYLKGARYDQAPQFGEYAPTYESRNPMAPNIPPGTEFSSGGMGMDPALMGALAGGLGPASAGGAASRSASMNLDAARRGEAAARGQYSNVMAGNQVPGLGSYQPPRDVRLLAEKRYIPTSYRSEFPDVRFTNRVTKDQPVLIPREGFNPKDTAFKRFPQDEAQFAQRRALKSYSDGNKTYRGYDKRFMQDATQLGGHTDDVADMSRRAFDISKGKVSDAIGQGAAADTMTGPGALLGSILGGTLGEGYSEVFGEGDTTYSDPTGEQRMKLRENLDNVTPDQTEEIGQALLSQIMSGEGQQEAPPMEAPPAPRAKMPARLSRGIKDVIQQREMMMQGAQEQPQQSIYSPLGQTPGPQYQSPYMATSPYEGY